MRTRDRYLIELGIRPWVRRDPAGRVATRADMADRVAGSAGEDTTVRAEMTVGAATAAGARPEPLAPAALRPTPTTTVTAPEGVSEHWRTLEDAVRNCTRCALHRGRTRTVFGVGDRRARLLVIGEAPGAEEDRKGEPFVGRAGQLLNAMLAAIGMDRRDVFIANILKCRPPGNRDPSAEEIATCTPYLREQIALQAPDVILAVGRIAAQWLLQTDTPVGRLREQVHGFASAQTSIPLVVSYHPAYLLRTPQAKAKAWDDLKQVRHLLGVANTPELAS